MNTQLLSISLLIITTCIIRVKNLSLNSQVYLGFDKLIYKRHVAYRQCKSLLCPELSKSIFKPLRAFVGSLLEHVGGQDQVYNFGEYSCH